MIFHFVDSSLLSPLMTMIVRWHTLFLFPVILFPTLYTFLSPFIPARGSANPFVAIIAIIQIASFLKAPILGFSLFVIAVFTALSEQQGNAIRIGLSSVFGIFIYLLSLYRLQLCLWIIDLSCLFGTVLAVLSGRDSEAAEKSKFSRVVGEESRISGLRFLYRFSGVLIGLAAVFRLRYIGFLVQDYGASLCRAKGKQE
jgi:hypothetical protein